VDGTDNSYASEEAVLEESGTYTFTDTQNENKTFECPGLDFSCKVVDLRINECTRTEGGFRASFSLINASVDDLKFQFKTTSRTLSHSKTARSAELKNFSIESTAPGDYFFELPTFPTVSQLQIQHPECVGKYYVYSSMECAEEKTTTEQSAEELPGNRLKCGGYLDIEDRVRCRVSLREDLETANEYENFFPEECRTRADGHTLCLQVYRNVQRCWAYSHGQERISCVKEELELGNIREERQRCKALTGEEGENCTSTLTRKVYDLVKFRLYDLEEEAEGFLEDGRITEEESIDFIVQMEKGKVAFNAAKNTQERKDVLLWARKQWIGLLQKLR